MTSPSNSTVGGDARLGEGLVELFDLVVKRAVERALITDIKRLRYRLRATD
jgi:hypothetical protein